MPVISTHATCFAGPTHRHATATARGALTVEAAAKRAQLIDAMALLGWTVGGTPVLPVFTRPVPPPTGLRLGTVSIRRDYAGWVFQWAEDSHYILFGYTCGSIPACLDELLSAARDAAHGYGL